MRVTEVSDSGAEFEVLEVFKSAQVVADTFSYENGTSCDEVFRLSGREYVIFGSWISGRFHIFEGNAMPSKYF